MHGGMRDAERMGVRNWRVKAKDRDGWRRLLESAKTLHGFSAREWVSEQGRVADSCVCGNKLSGSRNAGNFFNG